MAQWLGQFSGHTHATKAQGAEELLRHAVGVYRAADSDEIRAAKRKAVIRLARQLLAARLKLLGATLAAATDAQSGAALAERAGEIASLRSRVAATREGGLDAILEEFGVPA